MWTFPRQIKIGNLVVVFEAKRYVWNVVKKIIVNSNGVHSQGRPSRETHSTYQNGRRVALRM